jgi:dethiobiotin synthetase
MAKRIFVTATNTDIGKTYTTKKLLQEYAKNGLRVGAIKLIETGVIDGDAPDGKQLLALVQELNPEFKDVSLEDIVPITYELAAAPYIASRAKPLDFELLTAKIEKLEKLCDVLVIEGAGGLLVPIDGSFMMIDLILFFQATALLVTHCSLGCINDTLLSLQALKNRNISCVTAFNCRANDESFAQISEPFFLNTGYDVLKVENDIDTICDVLYNL